MEAKCLLSLSALLLLLGRSAAVCPDSWTQISDRCYKVFPEPVNWYSAQEVF